MGCTNSKENTNSSTAKVTEDDQQNILTEHFRQWLKENRKQAEQIVFNEIHSSENGKVDNEIESYRPIVCKALDLVCERQDIKTSNKLNKLIQKDLSNASSKKIFQTTEILRKTAAKLRDGKISLENSTNDKSGNGQSDSNRVENQSGQVSSGDPGIVLKEALESARILFYKGKQAAIFANPNGGYDVKIVDEHDQMAKEEGNLLRSIIVTEVKMRPKSNLNSEEEQTLNENEISESFRRSIDAAFKGLESICKSDRKQIDKENSICSSSSFPLVSTSNRLKNFLPNFKSTNQNEEEKEKNEHFSNLQKSSPVETNEENDSKFNSTNQNVIYTEIIRSESREGEQSRRVQTRFYDEPNNKTDHKSTSLQITTKSEFSNDPSAGEKIMEQTVQVISVKVRNQMTKNDS